MTRDEIVSSLISRLKSSFTIKKPLAPDTDVMEIELDSLDIMNYVAFLEDEFGLQISDEQIVPGGILVISTTADAILKLKS